MAYCRNKYLHNLITTEIFSRLSSFLVDSADFALQRSIIGRLFRFVLDDSSLFEVCIYVKLKFLRSYIECVIYYVVNSAFPGYLGWGHTIGLAPVDILDS